MTAVERSISLALIDDKWKDHLRTMDDLKQEVRTASYEQKDPLLVYKQEAYQLFENLIIDINENLCSFLAKVNIVANQEAQQAQQPAPSEKLTASRPRKEAIPNKDDKKNPRQLLFGRLRKWGEMNLVPAAVEKNINNVMAYNRNLNAHWVARSLFNSCFLVPCASLSVSAQEEASVKSGEAAKQTLVESPSNNAPEINLDTIPYKERIVNKNSNTSVTFYTEHRAIQR